VTIDRANLLPITVFVCWFVALALMLAKPL
jgi:hypothetical protein